MRGTDRAPTASPRRPTPELAAAARSSRTPAAGPLRAAKADSAGCSRPGIAGRALPMTTAAAASPMASRASRRARAIAPEDFTMTEVPIRLDPEEWQRVLAYLAQAPWGRGRVHVRPPVRFAPL